MNDTYIYLPQRSKRMTEIARGNKVLDAPAVPTPGVERIMDTLLKEAKSPSTPLATEVIEAAMQIAAEFTKDTKPRGS